MYRGNCIDSGLQAYNNASAAPLFRWTQNWNAKQENKKIKKGHLITLGGNVKKVIYLMSGEYFLKLKWE